MSNTLSKEVRQAIDALPYVSLKRYDSSSSDIDAQLFDVFMTVLNERADDDIYVEDMKTVEDYISARRVIFSDLTWEDDVCTLPL